MNDLTLDNTFMNKLFRKHALSAIISMFGALAGSIANTIMAGMFFGASGLAVMSIAAPFYALLSALGSLVCVGGATLTSYALGKDNQRQADEIFSLSVILCFALPIAVSLICLANLEPLLFLMGCTASLLEPAYNYSLIYLIGGFGMSILYLPYNFCRLVGKLRWGTGLFLAMAFLNILLNLIFIIIFRMDIEGIALGTVTASSVVSIFGIIKLWRDSFHFVIKFDIKTILSLMRYGSPPAFNNLLNCIRLLLMNRIFLAVAGNFGLAIFSVITTLENLSLVIISGLAQATSPFIGMFTKEGDTVSVRQIERQAHILGVTLIAAITVWMFIYSHDIALFFKIYIIEAHWTIRIFALSLLPTLICMLLFFYYQATGFTTVANILIFCRSFALIVLPAYLLMSKGLYALCAAFVIAQVGALIVLAFALRPYSKNRSRILLQDLQFEDSGRLIAFTIPVDKISDGVKKICDCCEKIKPLQLSLEKVMIDYQNHGAKYFDVRILIDSEITLRIRCDGKLYRVVNDNISYKDALGINNLTITVKGD